MESRRYVRKYILMEQDTAGYAAVSNHDIQGAFRLDARGKTGKIQLTIQNIKEREPSYTYPVFLICMKEGQYIPIEIGDLPIRQGKGTARAQFNADDIMDSGCRIEDIRSVAVGVKKEGSVIAWPAVGYINEKEVSWKRYVPKDNQSNMVKERESDQSNKSIEKKIQKEENISSSPLVERDLNEENGQEQTKDSKEPENVRPEARTDEKAEEKQQVELDRENKEEKIQKIEQWERTNRNFEETIEDASKIGKEGRPEESEGKVSSAWSKTKFDESVMEPREIKPKYSYNKNQNYAKTPETEFEFLRNPWSYYPGEMGGGLHGGLMPPFNPNPPYWNPNFGMQPVVPPSQNQNQFNQMFSQYPQMSPFEKKTNIRWIRIEPQDIQSFPRWEWQMMNNPVVLSGYERFNHLICGVEEKKGRKHYRLGVPSQLNPQEEYAAPMFGFSEFMPCKDKPPKTNDYGYWIHHIPYTT